MSVTINSAAPTTAQQREFSEAMGLPVLLQTITVSTAQQDLDFSSLDLNSDNNYRIELIVAVHSAANQEVFCYYNGDLTAANYQSQFLVGNSTTTASGRSASAAAALGGIPTNLSVTARSTILISKLPGKNPSLNSINAYEASSPSVGMNTTSYAHVWANTANVTSIKLRHTGVFGVGTVAKLYKV